MSRLRPGGQLGQPGLLRFGCCQLLRQLGDSRLDLRLHVQLPFQERDLFCDKPIVLLDFHNRFVKPLDAQHSGQVILALGWLQIGQGIQFLLAGQKRCQESPPVKPQKLADVILGFAHANRLRGIPTV